MYSRFIGTAALIAWMLVVRVGHLVKDRRPPEAAALRAVLDKMANANRVLSMRSRPLGIIPWTHVVKKCYER
jgi:hypothetical protein